MSDSFLLQSSISFIKRAILALSVLGFLFLLAPSVDARAGYDGLVMSVSPQTVSVASGASQVVHVQVQNTGTETWYQNGDVFVSAYSVNPNYHTSPYRGPSWYSDHQLGQLLETSVAPGQTGTLEFFVYGPPAFTGTLVESFRLAAEDTSWIGSSFDLTMRVGDTQTSVEATPVANTPAVSSSSNYGGVLVASSVNEVRAKAGQMIPLKLAFSNTGSTTWKQVSLQTPGAHVATGTASDFRHLSWVSDQIAYRDMQANVAPGQTFVADVFFQAPASNGQHTAMFQLVADTVELGDAVVNIPVFVTDGSPALLNQPVVNQVYRVGEMMEEPRVRVGIDQVTGQEVIFSANTAVRVLESDAKTERYLIPAQQAMRVNYNVKTGQYVFESGGVVYTAGDYLRFEGVDHNTIFTVASFSDVRSWNTSLNDNTFRDTLELRFNTVKDRTWLINELQIEDYLYAVDETSNTAPDEYHKALATTARTYALYAWEHKSKYAGEFIDLRSDTYDQVYHGYGAEIRRPNWVEQVKATAGQSIQYDGQTIIAAYFSRSDGHTRSWVDVWGRNVPYAIGVSVPCEVGQTMWGHGVGMSAMGAVCLAEEEGYSYSQILHHFYTDVDLIKRW
ncbi:hypothetical protein COV06_03360 [Candidatus Uhrbacteria bacterium CG10_big_fil_rev_8_21_14_0_10_50_16]|uniref:Sporulation stage II protein D amidase enhancer LytB N-terminal domain-containing protein n=1 Tax=Candidatus Uhrbacteria bacterium CG10_big_fil_rev_8_21_14_0_10_50_16 TaxID=1975039 RepID=A0A2H0RLP7_9BACT|nr:MAG: hypothetical protein COV06_03360 [Candidatus Uhrbacteria bacterium CG10_big_fil_rev_8_21_14_0_10_50_16]